MDPILNNCFIYFIAAMIAIVASWTTLEDYKLPDLYEPLSYQIQIKITHEAFTEASNEFTGEVQSIFIVKSETDYIKIHSHHTFIKIKRIQLNDKEVSSEDYRVNNVTDILEIDTSLLGAGSTGILFIEYTGVLNTSDGRGFYKGSYTDEDGKKKYFATTLFAPTHARRAFPCFDEPALKATFDFTFVFPNDLNILFNTLPFYVDTNSTTGLTTVSFKSTPKMSTYTLAFLISDFTCSEGISAGGVLIEVCSRRATAASRNLALQYVTPLLESFNNYTGIDYGKVMEKLSQVAFPRYATGAMENWGLITYKEKGLLWNESESANKYKQDVISIIAHELSHQWFGNLVTFDWWSAVFLNEGFATYFESLIAHEVLPQWEFDKQFVIREQHSIFLEDSLEHVHPLQSDVYTPADILARFNPISYNKGGCIFRMVDHFMGKDRFQAGIRNYIEKHKFGSVAPEDLWNALNRSVLESISFLPEDFTIIMENWITQPGYPVLYVSVNERNVTISQNRFVLSEIDNTTKWYVPISYSTSLDADKFQQTSPRLWLTPDNNETFILPINCSWIILNNKQSAYYRVNYDDDLWNNITTALLSDNFGGIIDLNRAQIVDDLFNLARAKLIRYTRVLSTIKFLANDISYYPWYSAFYGFHFLLKKVGEDSVLGKSISSNVLNLISKLYNSVPISTLDEHDQMYTIKQTVAYFWACRLGNADCINQAKILFQQYKSSGIRPNKNLRKFVYCYGLKHSSDSSDWKFLWDEYIKSSDLVTEQIIIGAALGCSEKEAILKEYLNKSITDGSGIKTQDALTVFTSVCKGSLKGVHVALEFLIANFEIMESRKVNTFGDIIVRIAERFTTESQISKLKIFIQNETLPEMVKTSAKVALETAKINLKWLETYRDELIQYYRNAGYRNLYVPFWILAAFVLLLTSNI